MMRVSNFYMHRRKILRIDAREKKVDEAKALT